MIVGAVFLLVAALGFVAAELFVPTHGLLALIAGVCALAAVVVASYASLTLGLFFGLAVVVAGPIIFFWAARIYPQTPVGRRVLLAPPLPSTTDAGDEPPVLAGDRGIAMTTLRPAGNVEIGERRINCVSEAEVIAAGTPVEVIRVQGSRVVVKALADRA